MEEEITIIERPDLRDRFQIFKNRTAAGKVLAKMLEQYQNSSALILAIPAGGVEVAVVVADELNLQMDVAVVSKITPPWSTEIGYGAVAFDGTVLINESLLPPLGLTDREIQEGTLKTKKKVQRRVNLLRGDRPMPDLSGRIVILVDDGVATGYTMRGALEAIRKSGAGQIIVAVPTGHLKSIQQLSSVIDAVYCANVRSQHDFAVADAYEDWHDLQDYEILKMLHDFWNKSENDFKKRFHNYF